MKESRKELMGELSYQMELVDIGEKTGQETKCLNERIGMLFKKVNALNEVVDRVYGVVPEVALIPESCHHIHVHLERGHDHMQRFGLLMNAGIRAFFNSLPIYNFLTPLVHQSRRNRYV